MTVKRRIPVTFQNVLSIDDRFMKVKIILMHLQENFNGSYFSKEVVEKAIWSLANTPILGFIEEDSAGNNDFSNHRSIIVKEDGKYKSKYIGQAYGVIPEDNNARFEDIEGVDGRVRTYLVCDGLLWTKFDDAVDIMKASYHKGQSMELHDDYDGYMDESTGLFHFTDFKFFGACILGDSVSEAMIHASIELQFSENAFSREIQNKMEEFKLLYSKQNQDVRGGENVKDKLLAVLKEFNMTEEMLQDKGYKLEDFAEEDELKLILQGADSEAENGAGVTEPEPEPKPEPLLDEGAGQDQDQDEADVPEVTAPEQEVTEPTDTGQVDETDADVDAGDAGDAGDGAAEFSKEMYEKEVEKYKADFEAIKAELEALEQEVANLRGFKAERLAQDRAASENEIFSKFASQLTEEEMQGVREIASTLELSQIEKELFALVGMKSAKFSKHKEKTNANVKIDFSIKDDNKATSSYEYLLEKHLK